MLNYQSPSAALAKAVGPHTTLPIHGLSHSHTHNFTRTHIECGCVIVRENVCVIWSAELAMHVFAFRVNRPLGNADDFSSSTFPPDTLLAPAIFQVLLTPATQGLTPATHQSIL